MIRSSELIVILLGIIPLVWALGDVLRWPTSAWTAAGQSRSLWILVLIILPLIGPLLYLLFARPRLDPR
ncbi:MAG TPA: PLDc N-terminal domain-containing protein [Acidimicrobiia bacterium]|nr:PLDc N-terminal domain-containing protein [Acidimicrobiia bacterium]